METRVDEFTGETSIELHHDMQPEGSGPRGGELAALGRSGARPVALLMSVPSDNWRYLHCDSVHILADGQPVPVEDGHRDRGDILRGGVIEHIVARLPWASVVQLASAQSVRIRICNDVYSFDSSFTRNVNELAQRMWGDAAQARAEAVE